MRLYEINAAMAELLSQVDEETGELLCSPEDLDQLQMDRQDALEGIALAIKNDEAEAAAIRAEEQALAKRRERLESKAARTRAFLADMLRGDTLRTPRVVISYRKSETVELDDEFWLAPDARFLTQPKPKENRTEIKKALKAGEVVPGAWIEQHNNMQIK